MMILTVNDIIKDALGLVNATAMEETPTAGDAQLALRVLNVMIDRWSAQRLMLRSTTNDTFTLTAGKYKYTIGTNPTCDVVTAKPIQIVNVWIRDGANNDSPINIIDKITYNTIGDKIIATGPVEYLYFDPGNAQQSTYNTGTIYLYPIPDSNYKLQIQSDKYLTEFVNLSDVVNFEPAYYEAIIYNLAERLFRYFHTDTKQLPTDITGIARASKHTIEVMNSVQYTATMDLPGKLSNFNIYSGDYNQ